MNVVYGSPRGAFKKVDITATKSIISVPGFSELAPEASFVSAINAMKSEKKSIIQCFNNVNHVYAFGHDPEGSKYSVTFGVFLSDGTCPADLKFKSGGNLAKFVDKYKSENVSSSPKTISVSIDDGCVLSGILVGMNVDVADASVNLVSVTLAFNDMNNA